MDFSHTISYLSARLNSPLPGREAHRRALPSDRIEKRLGIEVSPDARLGGVLILLFPGQGDETMFPLIQRTDYPGTHGGQVSLPGGKFEEGDKDLIGTALRETHEEIGVAPEAIRVLGKMSEIYIPPSNFRVLPVLGYVDHYPSFVPEPKEVDEILEVPLAHLMDHTLHKSTDIEVRGMRLPDTPYFDFHDRVVWGATAMILSELYEVLTELSSGS